MDITKTQPEPAAGGSDCPSRLGRADRVVLALAGLGLLATALLGNPAASAREWPAGSILQYIVWVVSLGYRLPTLRGIEAKTLLVSVIGGVLLAWATTRILRGRLRLLHDLPESAGHTNQRVSAATLSLFAVLLLIAWALASALWARNAATAIGSAWVLSLGWLWAAGLGLHGHRRLARPLTDVLLAAASLTAALSLWYWHERAIEARLGWPLGNPLSLASVMVPTVLLAAGRLAEQIRALQQTRHLARTAALIAVYGGALALTGITLWATGSRGPLLAVLVGGAVAVWTVVPPKQRLALSLAGLVGLTMAAPAAADWLFGAGGGRDASARMRVYAWHDALQLAANKPAAGQGAGAFALLSTGLSAPDCVLDPLAMSGQVSSDAHCEPLELLADLGVFGGVIGLAIWGFALAAAIGRASGPDRWLAAAVAGALTAAFVDAATGVSWRLPGPAPFLAMPAALAWMLWRDPPASGAAARSPRSWVALLPAALGIALLAGGILDFAAARFLYRGQVALRQAERLFAAVSGPTAAEAQTRGQEATELAAYAVRQADLAARWQMDPVRRLVAQLASGKMRIARGYLPAARGVPGNEPAAAQSILDDGIRILERLNQVAPGYADTDWGLAELWDDKASLARAAHDEPLAGRARSQGLQAALRYLSHHPLDPARVDLAVHTWLEIEPARRLSLLRGKLRPEAVVWRQERLRERGYVHWSQMQLDAMLTWQQTGEQAAAVQNDLLEAGYSALRPAYRQWQDPLAPEAVRLAAARLVLQGEPTQAADALDLANLLYERTGGLLPYSQAATHLDLAACRIRQGIDQAAWAGAALTQARQILRPLPDSPVRQQLLEVADALEQGIGAAAGTYSGKDSDAWRTAVDLFWVMPAANWPPEIQAWAERSDAAIAGEAPGSLTLQLLVGRGDLEAAQARVQQMLAQGPGRIATAAALREARHRWPQRQALVATLLQQVEQEAR